MNRVGAKQSDTVASSDVNQPPISQDDIVLEQPMEIEMMPLLHNYRRSMDDDEEEVKYEVDKPGMAPIKMRAKWFDENKQRKAKQSDSEEEIDLT